MYGIKVSLIAETASFRDPGGQLFHSSLPLPPVSTIVGIAGAALGWRFDEVWNWFKEFKVHVGVSGSYLGKGKDLWNNTKRTIGLEKSERRDILNREFLCFTSRSSFEKKHAVSLYFGCEDEKISRKLHQSFINPFYALSLGLSDDMAKCQSVMWYEDISKDHVDGLSNVMVVGDKSKDFDFDWETIHQRRVQVSLSAPIVKQLPVNYEFDKYGVRKAISYQDFTFLNELQQLTTKIPVYRFDQENVPLALVDNA